MDTTLTEDEIIEGNKLFARMEKMGRNWRIGRWVLLAGEPFQFAVGIAFMITALVNWRLIIEASTSDPIAALRITIAVCLCVSMLLGMLNLLIGSIEVTAAITKGGKGKRDLLLAKIGRCSLEDLAARTKGSVVAS